MSRRVFLIVTDSMGCGSAPDAARFGDEGSDTLGSCVRAGLRVPTLERLGLFRIPETSFAQKNAPCEGAAVRLLERAPAKDTVAGHWELAGHAVSRPFPVFPEGFPEEVLDAFRRITGRDVLCNRPYSGTEVIRDYGPEHEKTGAYIVYTSADSVFQVAAHESVIPVETLYRDCEAARSFLRGEYGVGRVIARPFTGTFPHYERTVRRHDFCLAPTGETLCDAVAAAGLDSVGVGKIGDIFAGRGLTESFPNEGNERNMERVLSLAERDLHGLVFVNLVDTDAVYGHRRDLTGYVACLEAFDRQLGQLADRLRSEDLLIVTADHGCDPCFKGTDHTREAVPCLMYGKAVRPGTIVGTRDTFADLAATLAEYLGLPFRGDGKSFWPCIAR